MDASELNFVAADIPTEIKARTLFTVMRGGSGVPAKSTAFRHLNPRYLLISALLRDFIGFAVVHDKIQSTAVVRRVHPFRGKVKNHNCAASNKLFHNGGQAGS
jgi:hypothetical protein